MRVVLATGIYPPEIGGPATYVRELSRVLRAKGVEVRIVAYGDMAETDSADDVVRVARDGGPVGRYIRYARVLRRVAGDADIVEAFSSVSAGVPLWMSHMRHPKKILRLGGDFLWERATDAGEERGLAEWYDERPRFTSLMNGLLRTFDTIVFSTEFQEELFRRVYHHLPSTVVIENVSPRGTPTLHVLQRPARLLYLGRFVPFKNLAALVSAMRSLPEMHLTLAGSGPLEETLREQVRSMGLEQHVTFLPPQHGEQKTMLFARHDLLVLPSRTEISPNTALEARAAGLPVLLTEQTGLSRILQDGMVTMPLGTTEEIAAGIAAFLDRYDIHAAKSAEPLPERDWNRLADEHIALFTRLL